MRCDRGNTFTMEDTEPRSSDWWQRHENEVMSGEYVRVELFVRTLGAGPGTHRRQSAILDRIDRLNRRDVIDEANVSVWGDRVCVSECCSKNSTVRSVRDRIDLFREWGQEKPNVRLGFERRTVSSSMTDEEFDVIDLPTACLAVYDDDGLSGLFPATIGEDEWTIETYLDWFERSRNRTETRLVADA